MHSLVVIVKSEQGTDVLLGHTEERVTSTLQRTYSSVLCMTHEYESQINILDSRMSNNATVSVSSHVHM